ncbi:MAG: hypothetical protein II883_08225 [Spirochaetales bacterium]|nr:hypothetical protein [Spirochaetales bacterium]
MTEIRNFIDQYYDQYNKMNDLIEEDQKLPPKDVLEEVCSVLLNVSCMREEGNFSSFRLCFLDPDSSFLDAYVYAHSLRFAKPVPFSVAALRKLAPAINPTMSYLALDLKNKPLMVTGIIASYTTWDKVITGELSDGSRMPLIPNLFVKAPGEIEGCLGEDTIVSYNFGTTVISRYDVFKSSLIAQHLRNGSSVDDDERRHFLTRVLWKVDKYHHGGSILIVPSEESCAQYVNVKYRLPCEFLFHDEKSLIDMFTTVREKELVSYADFIAKLTTVDGAVLITKEMDLIGFGVEILTDKMEQKEPPMKFISSDDSIDQSKRFTDNGTRHRSGYRFAYEVDESVVLIMSQDGSVKACTRENGDVIVYNNIALTID